MKSQIKTEDFNYSLPSDLIAGSPSPKRDQSRLLVLDRQSKKISHSRFSNIIEFLNKGDVLVLNDTKVMPARLFGKKDPSGGKVEILLLKKTMDDSVWECLAMPAKRLKKGYEIIFKKCRAKIVDEIDDSRRLIKFFYKGDFDDLIKCIGVIPLPPYILSQYKNRKAGKKMIERYQTVFAKKEGASAAPTAGLHFTNKLLQNILHKGINILHITLHTGAGTFKPVVCKYVNGHKMFSEEYEIGEKTASAINKAKKDKKRIVAVGTTSVRALEDCYLKNNKIKACKGDANIFIYPPFKFRVVDSLITNFHFPKTTLLMLVSAFGGRDFIFSAYEEAIKEKYRFYSFGDAMLII